MKKTMRFLGVVFALIMVLCCVQFAFAAEYNLTVDAPLSVSIDRDETDYIYFTPDITGTYKVTFKGDGNFAVYEDDSYYSDSECKIEITDNFEAGQSYEFEIYAFAVFPDVPAENADVKATLLCSHENKTVTPAFDFTCTTDGSSEKITCDDCGWVLKENHVLPARHLDADNDYVCDVCSGETLLLSDTYEDIYYDDDGNTVPYTMSYKLYANGDLYVDSNGYFSTYEAKRLGEFFDKLYVPNIDDYLFKIRNIYVGKDVCEFSFSRSYGCEKYIVDPQNKVYSSDSTGVLFSLDGKEIIDVPWLWKETSYDIPAGVEIIPQVAFNAAKYLKTVTIPSSVKFIGYDAFDCNILACCETVDGLVYIGDALIDESGKELTVAKVKEGTRIIAEDVACYDGIVYEIPASVEHISGKLYGYVSAYLVDENNGYYSDIDGVLFNKDKSVLIAYPGGIDATEYVVPDGVKEIGDDAFSYSEIYDVTLPEGLEKIGDSAFSGTNLSDIDLPLSLKEIGSYAFYVDDEINVVILHKNIEKLGNNPFECKTIVILNPDCEMEYIYSYIMIVGYDGSTAEKLAKENGNLFATLGGVNGENHKHIYFPKTITAATCTTEGSESFTCPCGNTETYTRVVEATDHNWYYYWEDEDIGESERVCTNCGLREKIYDSYDCDCECHNDMNKIQEFIFRIKILFWKIFRINEFCVCGDYHW